MRDRPWVSVSSGRRQALRVRLLACGARVEGHRHSGDVFRVLCLKFINLDSELGYITAKEDVQGVTQLIV